MTGQASLRGLVAALLPPEHGGPPSDAVVDRIATYLDRLPAPHATALRALAVALDTVVLLRHGRRLADLPPDRRALALDRLAGRAVTDPVLALMKALVLLATGTGAVAEELRSRAHATMPVRPDPPLSVQPSSMWPAETPCDVVVVGSGAGGAMVARTLARAGADVVVAEEGRRFTVEDFRDGDPLHRFAALYRDGGATAALGRPPVLLPIGRAVGGSTVVNSGTCYAPPVRVLRRWRDQHGLALADPDRLVSHVREVEATLGVAPTPLEVMGSNGLGVLAGAARLGWRAEPLRRNAPGCSGSCECSIGCPRNAKAGVHLNALPQACEAGARIVSEARVERILHDRGRATGVAVRRPDGSRLLIRAPIVVVAAGATESPTLVARSGLARHPAAGRNLTLHPGIGTAGRFPDPVHAWRGVLQSAAIEELHDRHGILIEATATPPGMGSTALPGHGRRLLAELAGAHHLRTLGAMVADEPRGRVVGMGRHTAVHYSLSRRDAGRLLLAIAAMGKVLFAAGAIEVLPGLSGTPAVASQRELHDALSRCDVRQLKLAAFHPSGTLAAGADPERHPVDASGRLRGIDGVWVADASLLPSCAEVNPQVSIMALALAVADEVGRGPSAERGRPASPP